MTKKESHCKAYSDFLDLKLSNYRRVYTKCASKHNYPAAGRSARVKAAGKQVEIASNGRVYTKCASKHNYPAAGRRARVKAAGKQVEIASNGRVYMKSALKYDYPAAGRSAQKKTPETHVKHGGKMQYTIVKS